MEGIERAATKEKPPKEQLEPYKGHNEPGAEFSSAEGSSDPEESDQQANEGSTNQSLVPSSLGFTFCIDGDVDAVELEVRWGRYERGESETEVSEKTGKPMRAWKRIPSGGKQTLLLKQGSLEPFAIDATCPEVLVQGTVRPKLPKGDRLVTIFLVNNQTKPEENQDAAWVFQPELIVRGIGNAAVFRRRPVLDADGHDRGARGAGDGLSQTRRIRCRAWRFCSCADCDRRYREGGRDPDGRDAGIARCR